MPTIPATIPFTIGGTGPQAGTATGNYSLLASATGESAPRSGWSSSVSATTHTVGSGAGSYDLSGTAAGIDPDAMPSGSVEATTNFRGLAAGQVSPSAWSSPIDVTTGSDSMSGSVTRAYDFTGSAVGMNLADPVLPGLIDGIEPEAMGSFCGPVMDSNGSLYRVTEEYLGAGGPGFGNHPMMMKSADGGQTWVRMDAANGPGYGVGGSFNDMEAAWLVQSGNKLHLFWMKSKARIFSATYCTSNHPTTPDKWVTAETTTVYIFPTSPSESALSGAALSNGDLWYFYGTDPSGFQRIGYRRRTGTTWGAQSVFDDAANVVHPAAVVGVNDLTHIFYKDHGVGQIYYRNLSSSGTLSPRTRVDTGGAGTADTYYNNVVVPVHYTFGSSSVTTVAFVNGSRRLRTVDIIDGVVQPEMQVSADTLVVDPVGATSGTDNMGPSAALAVHGTTLYALWGDVTTGDLYYATRPHGGTWSARTLLVDTGTGNAVHWLYAKTLSIGSQTFVGFTYDVGPHADDDSNIYYDRLMLGSPGVTVNAENASANARAHAPSGESQTVISSSGLPTALAFIVAPVITGISSSGIGSAGGGYNFAGAMGGAAPTRFGSVTRGYDFTTTATGLKPALALRSGAASGQIAFVGSVDGGRISIGSSTGTVDYQVLSLAPYSIKLPLRSTVKLKAPRKVVRWRQV